MLSVTKNSVTLPIINSIINFDMEKFLKLSLALICCVFMGMSLSSCGDDEPIISNDIQTSELTTPMFLFEQPNGAVSSIVNGFSFWTFTNEKAAYGTFALAGNRPVLKCTELYNTWTVADGKLVLGNVSHNLTKINVLGVKAYTIDLTVYIPSNLTISNFKAETVFTELGLNKEKLWNGLERAKQEGPVYIDEL